MMWLIPMIAGVALVLGGVAMLLQARALKKSHPPQAPNGALDGSLPERGVFGVPYQRRDRVHSLRQRAVGTIAVAGVVTLVSAWHVLGH